MKLIYSTQRSGFKKGFSYRNPRHFEQTEEAESVEVIGNWPDVIKAYEDAGIDVSKADGKEQKPEDYSKLTVAQIKEVLGDKGIAIPDGAKRDDLLALLEGK